MNKYNMDETPITKGDTPSPTAPVNSCQGKNNRIYFYKDVNTSSVLQLNEDLQNKYRECKIFEMDYDLKDIPVYLHINSNGGTVISAFCAVDYINELKEKIKVVSVVEGLAASAATIISVVCSDRQIRSNSYMLIHQLSSAFWGNYTQLIDDMKNTKMMMKKIIDIYKNNTKIPSKKLRNLLKHDLMLDAETCLKYGLIDKII